MAQESIKLSDGRQLAYTEFGTHGGKPIFYFHGRDGSRLEAGFGQEAQSTQLGIRFICPDRPGIGLSDFQPGRKISNWPDDVVELAEHLSIDKFAVLGGSGGAPYALACAYRIPDYLTGCAIVSGLGPYNLIKNKVSKQNRNQLTMVRLFPWLYRLTIWVLSRNFSNEQWWEKQYEKLQKILPEADQKIISNPEIKKRMIDKTISCYHQGTKGPTHDFKLYTKPWGFKLDEISDELLINIFHGELDINVPLSIAQDMSKHILNSKLTVYPKEGHMSTYINHFTEIISKLLE